MFLKLVNNQSKFRMSDIMKNLQVPLYCLALATLFSIAVLVGCTTSQQTTGFQTISGVEATATAAVNTYDDAVIKGQLSTNSLPEVSQAFNQLQIALKLAAAADQAGMNGLAPANLIAQSQELINLINTVKIQSKP
jgi:hypothetical protein